MHEHTKNGTAHIARMHMIADLPLPFLHFHLMFRSSFFCSLFLTRTKRNLKQNKKNGIDIECTLWSMSRVTLEPFKVPSHLLELHLEILTYFMCHFVALPVNINIYWKRKSAIDNIKQKKNKKRKHKNRKKYRVSIWRFTKSQHLLKLFKEFMSILWQKEEKDQQQKNKEM